MKCLGLDIGDVWTGIALSDALGITVRPYATVLTKDLSDELLTLFKQELINTVVVGYPKTMRGTESDQTRKSRALKEKLHAQFPEKKWVLWDERLSSKHAQKIKRGTDKETKLTIHAIAAALILETYLQYLVHTDA
jgi:putative holliday junction resolvase